MSSFWVGRLFQNAFLQIFSLLCNLVLFIYLVIFFIVNVNCGWGVWVVELELVYFVLRWLIKCFILNSRYKLSVFNKVFFFVDLSVA